MALLDVDLFSESLEVGTSLSVVLPQTTRAQIGVDPVPVPEHGWPVLFLLHGLSDDHTAWLRYTAIERHAGAAGLAVVMPAAGRSFYTDEAHGHDYWTWISQELPARVAEMFRLSTRPRDTYVAGLSMGGYGALKLGLTHPERYAGVASLSGAVDLRQLEERPERSEVVERVFGVRCPRRPRWSTCWRKSTRQRCHRSTSAAAPTRTGCSPPTSGSPSGRSSVASTSPRTSDPATTSGVCGTP